MGRMGRMGRTRDEMLQAADAKMRRVHDVLSKLETDLASAIERAEQIANEPFDTQEQAAAISRRVEIAEQDIERLKEEVAEAEDDWRRANADFEHYFSGAGDDDDDADGDTGETLSVWDAADIWLSNGMDEDYRFGYTEDELRRAAEE
jgi:molecular chaperone GrpE (heat shock protein)